ncbi:formate/nitrite transporter family protein [Citreimonas salinaria]|uniref:Formate/nitrite transporter FocA, FNT family n=1 Tax=Citreimonas salinaria TaxID=321339 RepID=A0A1H3J520_9RHOB|nr:formate/nitrite transporter family protein [Citreimonas salinaria]SDY34639.1 Formate/nitrite transporter FocA, FNT family [Citreimonas salinaria]
MTPEENEDSPSTGNADPRDNDNAVRHEREEHSVSEATRLSARLIYEVVRRDGEEELRRPLTSLSFSGTAAGILMGLSVLSEAILRTYLPDRPSSFLLENFGYSMGFIVVIFGRMQLFTENTITTVLPVIARPERECITDMLRLWSIVLAANVLGTMIAAAFLSQTTVISPEVKTAVVELSRHAVHMPADESFLRGLPAGMIVAAIVWMMPSAQGNAFFIVLTFTWLIAVGDFTHIIAGSVEMFYLLMIAETGLREAVFGFFLPVLAGNVLGGTAIFTLLAWGQVRNEVKHGTGSGRHG